MAGFDAYKKRVLNAYNELKLKQELPSVLENPSPAQLRNYCVLKFLDGVENRDLEKLNKYFNPKNQYFNLEEAIKRFDIDRFRPLINMMKRGTNTNNDNHIKLIAWLIDYPERPYEGKYIMAGINSDANVHEIASADKKNSFEEQIDGKVKPEEATEIPPSVEILKEKKNPKLLYISATIITVLLGGYFMPKELLKSSDYQCMYWRNDRYIAVDCQDQTIPIGVAKIALDPQKLNGFYRITKPDTLTMLDLGKIYYTRITNDSLDYFTGPGNHPNDPQKHLKPLTKYILEKHIYRQ